MTAPQVFFTGLQFEQMLPRNVKATAMYVDIRARNFFNTRNINAPLPGTFDLATAGSGIKPYEDYGDIYLQETVGKLNGFLFTTRVEARPTRYITMFVNYFTQRIKGNTDGPGSFPANSYDLSNEYGRAAFEMKHAFTIFSMINLPKGITLSPMMQYRSGRPFNITTGIDTNGDHLFTERPAYASASTKPENLRVTKYGSFDINPEPGTALIPRNNFTGPDYFVLNLRASRVFAFGPAIETPGQSRPAAGGSSAVNRRYKMTLTISASNLLNNTNLGNVVGNLNSPFFGQSTSLAFSFGSGVAGNAAAGNRRVQAQLRFDF
jgi:hypothetical protein